MSASYKVEYPEGMDEYEWEIEAKGWLPGVVVRSGRRQWTLTVYDPIRLHQDITSDLRTSQYVALADVLVVPQVTRHAITTALDTLATTAFTDLSEPTK